MNKTTKQEQFFLLHSRPAQPGKQYPLCKVCGCRTDFNNSTCDNVCTRARRAGLTRGRQMRHDVRMAAQRDKEARQFAVVVSDGFRTDTCFYNRPYLRQSFA